MQYCADDENADEYATGSSGCHELSCLEDYPLYYDDESRDGLRSKWFQKIMFSLESQVFVFEGSYGLGKTTIITRALVQMMLRDIITLNQTPCTLVVCETVEEARWIFEKFWLLCKSSSSINGQL